MTRIIMLAILVVGAVLVGGLFLVRRLRAPTEDVVLRFQCPGCRRRLSYKGRQRGHRGKCPQCRQVLRFPVVADGLKQRVR